MATNDARAQLRSIIRPKRSVDQIARQLGVSRQTVYFWLEGRATPIEKHRKKMEKHYGISAEAWI